MFMEWLMRKGEGKKSLLSRWGKEGKYALNFWLSSLPIWSEKRQKETFFLLSGAAKGKIVFHMDTHIIMRYMLAFLWTLWEREGKNGFTCSSSTTKGHGALIYGLCVVFHHSIINDHCVPISHFLSFFPLCALFNFHPPSTSS